MSKAKKLTKHKEKNHMQEALNDSLFSIVMVE